MVIRKYFFFLFFLLLSHIPALAQVEEAWVRRYSGPGYDFDIPNALAVDNSGNVYVTGFSRDTATADNYLTIKYGPNGAVLWVKQYDGPAKNWDEARAIAVNDSGNVYVTGRSFTIGAHTDYATIKYSPLGETLWVRRYGGTGLSPDIPNALSVDKSGNVYITGLSATDTSGDYTTIKYTPNGDTAWVKRYNGIRKSGNEAYGLVVDGNGNVYVTGNNYDNNYSDYVTIKYNKNGDTLWVRRYNGPVNGRDVVGSILFPGEHLVVDKNGNVYVTGTSASNLSYPFNYDYATIKYSPNGDSLWVKRYNSAADSNDFANAIAVDSNGNIYVTGVSRGIRTSDDIATIKYSPNGDQLWVRRYDGPNGWDGGRAIAVDSSGNVYVCGYSRSGTLEDFITIKYDPEGNILWQMRYNGPVDSNDIANAMVIDSKGNVYVTGRSIGTHSYQDHDYATVKYVQYDCLAKPGDVNGDNLILFSDLTSIIDFLFKGQPAPNPVCRGDANEDGTVLLSDIVYLINFLFKSGPAPSKNKECCL